MQLVHIKMLQEIRNHLKIHKAHLSYILCEDLNLKEDEKNSENLEVAISYMAWTLETLKAVLSAVEEKSA